MGNANLNRKRPPGRPPKPKGQKQTEGIMVRVTPADKRLLAKDAKAAGFDSLAAFLVFCWQEQTGRGE